MTKQTHSNTDKDMPDSFALCMQMGLAFVNGLPAMPAARVEQVLNAIKDSSLIKAMNSTSKNKAEIMLAEAMKTHGKKAQALTARVFKANEKQVLDFVKTLELTDADVEEIKDILTLRH